MADKLKPGFYWVSWGTGLGTSQRVIAEFDGDWWTITGSEHMWPNKGPDRVRFPGLDPVWAEPA